MTRLPSPPPAFSAYDRFLRRQEAPVQDARAQSFLRALAGAGREFGVPGVTSRLAAEVAALQAGLGDDDREALTVLAWCVLAAAGEGSVRVPLDADAGPGGLDAMVERLRAAMVPRVEDRPEDPGEAVEGCELPPNLADWVRALLDARRAPDVVGYAEDARRPLLCLDAHVYAERHLRLERQLVTHVRSRRAPEPVWAPDAVEAAIADVRSRPARTSTGEAMHPNDEQLAAVRACAARSLTLLSGGPGTGKTYTAATILRVLVRLGVRPAEVALAAPTGKAAQRMREALTQTLDGIEEPAGADRDLAADLPEARTLHRLLGYSPTLGRFRHHRNHPIPERVVLVDEASMADLRLAERLLGAVRPDARLVLIGDADQLPSVAAGAVFRDLVEALDGVRLVTSHRMRADDPAGRAILTAARSVRDGETPEVPETADVPGPDGIARRSVDWSKRDGLAGFLDGWFGATHQGPAVSGLQAAALPTDLEDADAQARLSGAFAELAEARILAVTRRGPSGVNALNRGLHERTRHAMSDRGGAWLPGEPVMITENDYELGLFNGDQGLVAWIGGRRPSDLHAVFARSDGRYEAFPLAAVKPRLAHAYALTVHKAQGSEYRRVAVVLPKEDTPLLSRELLYTAITRASKAVLLVGDAVRVADAAGRSEQRHCGVAERLTRAT